MQNSLCWRGIWIMEIILKVRESSHTSLLFRGPSWTKPMMSSNYISQFIEDTIQQNPFTRPKLDSKQEQWAITKARLWWFEMQKLVELTKCMNHAQLHNQQELIGRWNLQSFRQTERYALLPELVQIWFSNHIKNCSSYKGNQILIESILQSGIHSICLQLNSS